MKPHNPGIPVKITVTAILATALGIFSAASLPAQAFPCSKASTQVELAICARPELKKADDAMERAYFVMRDNLQQSAVTLLTSSQRNWLKYRNSNCQAEPTCLLYETENRSMTLAKISRYQPAMVPVFKWQPGGKNAYFIKFTGVKFASIDGTDQSAGLNAFNRAIDRQIAKAPWGETTDDQTLGLWEHETNLSVNQLTSRMISATATTYNSSGGAHPNSWSQSININLQTGRAMKTGDLFSDTSIKALISDCGDMIIETKTERFGSSIEEARIDLEQSYPGAVESHVLDMSKWRFNDSGAVIGFDPYAIGAYVEGPYSCEFSSKYIRRMARKSGVLEK